MLQTTTPGSFSAKLSQQNHPPVKQTYSEKREYLFPHEVEELRKAARNVGRHGLRDATIILLQLKLNYSDTQYVFVSERKAPLSTRSVRQIISRAGQMAGLPFPVHSHQLRHACGYYLAAQGHDTRAIQDYLGHRNIQHTVRYTQLNPSRFENFWLD